MIAIQAVVLTLSGTLPDLRILALLGAGLIGGLVLLARGFGGYRAAGRVSGIAASRISSLAAGEVLITGTAESLELTLVSPLQSSPCVYYRSRITDRGSEGGVVFREERAVGFRVRDDSGAIRVFPADAQFDVPDRYDEATGLLGGSPIGFLPRSGSAFGPGPDRDAQIAALLTVHLPPDQSPFDHAPSFGGVGAAAVSGIGLPIASRDRHLTEARIEPGDVVTIVGRAVPFGDLADPATANLLGTGLVAPDDPEIAADIAAARAAGTLEASASEAWGNASIEGFGIGRPARPPELDPLAAPLPAADPALLARVRDAFDIPAGALVLASAVDAPLLVAAGPPRMMVARERDRFIVGLLGAALAIGCAIGLAVLLAGSSA